MNARAYKSLETQTRPNTLPDIEFTEWDTPIIGAPEKNRSVRTAGKISPEAKLKRKRAVLYISMISVVFMMLSGIVYRYSMIRKWARDPGTGNQNRRIRHLDRQHEYEHT